MKRVCSGCRRHHQRLRSAAAWLVAVSRSVSDAATAADRVMLPRCRTVPLQQNHNVMPHPHQQSWCNWTAPREPRSTDDRHKDRTHCTECTVWRRCYTGNRYPMQYPPVPVFTYPQIQALALYAAQTALYKICLLNSILSLSLLPSSSLPLLCCLSVNGIAVSINNARPARVSRALQCSWRRVICTISLHCRIPTVRSSRCHHHTPPRQTPVRGILTELDCSSRTAV